MEDYSQLKTLVLNRVILPIVKEENGKKIVTEKDLSALHLSEGEQRLCIEIMQRHNIDFQREMIEVIDRSKLVRDLDYGEVQADKIEDRDVPKYAEISYDQFGNVIYENYEKLDDFLENKFLPNHVRYQTKRGDKSGKLYQSVQLNEIIKLRLCELENKHVMEFLNTLDVMVRGRNSSIDQDFENYDCMVSYKGVADKSGVKSIDFLDQIPLFYQLRETNDPNLRQKLIVNNLDFAPFVLRRCRFVSFSDDSLQVAYEGLIKAVDHYDPSYGVLFSTYAFTVIVTNLKRHYPELVHSPAGDMSSLWQFEFRNCRKVVEEMNNSTINENMDLVDDIVELMIKDGVVSPKNRQLNIERIKMYFCTKSYEEILETDNEDVEELGVDDSLLKNANFQMLRLNLEKILATLEPREQKVLRLRFGLNNGTPMTQEQIGRELNLSGGRIGQIEAKALRKLRHPSREKYLRDYLDGDDFSRS